MCAGRPTHLMQLADLIYHLAHALATVDLWLFTSTLRYCEFSNCHWILSVFRLNFLSQPCCRPSSVTIGNVLLCRLKFAD
jgi:hypothetical protein